MSHRPWVQSPQGVVVHPLALSRMALFRDGKLTAHVRQGTWTSSCPLQRTPLPFQQLPDEHACATLMPRRRQTTFTTIGHHRQPRFRGKVFHGFDQGSAFAGRMYSKLASVVFPPTVDMSLCHCLAQTRTCSLHPAPHIWMPPFGSSSAANALPLYA